MTQPSYRAPSDTRSGMASRLLWVRRLGIACVALTFVLMVLGAWVKATGSGLACPDWPRCYGEWLPPFPSNANEGTWEGQPVAYSQAQILYEWGHRALASLIAVPILAFAILVLRNQRLRPSLRVLAGSAAGLLAVQGGLGAVTVHLGNVPWATTLHLSMAVVFFGTILVATCMAHFAPYPRDVSPSPATAHPAFVPGADTGFVYEGREEPHGR